MGVGTVTVAMAGAAVSSSDFSSSILGTPGASEDKSFKIFLAKTVCCRDFNKNWGERNSLSDTQCWGKLWSAASQQGKYEWRMKTTHYLQTLIGEDCSKCQALMAKGASTEQLCLSKPMIQLLQPFLFLQSMFLSSIFICFLLSAI